MVAETDAIYREASARYHRTLAHYFAIYAWQKKVDALYLYREQIMHLLKLSKITQKRVEWFEEDVRPWFPQMKTMWYSNSSGKLHSVILSRTNLPASTMSGVAGARERIRRLNEAGVPTVGFLDGGSLKLADYNESKIVSAMSLVATGISELSAIPGLQVPRS